MLVVMTKYDHFDSVPSLLLDKEPARETSGRSSLTEVKGKRGERERDQERLELFLFHSDPKCFRTWNFAGFLSLLSLVTSRTDLFLYLVLSLCLSISLPLVDRSTKQSCRNLDPPTKCSSSSSSLFSLLSYLLSLLLARCF